MNPYRHFGISIDIDAPPHKVSGIMQDVVRWHEWTASITSVTRLDEGPLRVGARARIRQPKLPPALWEVTEVEPLSFTWVSAGPGVRVTARHWVEPAGTGSRASLSLDYAGIFGGLIGRLTAGITNHYLSLEANGLKKRSEGR